MDPSCSLCHARPETIDHFFVDCIESKNLYFEISEWLKSFDIIMPPCSKRNIIVGVDDVLINFIILLFKLYLYQLRGKNNIYISVSMFKYLVLRYNKIEEKVALNRNKIEIHKKKWDKLKEI